MYICQWCHKNCDTELIIVEISTPDRMIRHQIEVYCSWKCIKEVLA